MGTGRFNIPFISILTLTMVLACTPFAAAQTEDPFCNSYTICIALIILVGIPLLMSYLKKKKEEELAAQRLPGAGQPGMVEPVPRGYDQAPSYGTTPYPSGAPGYPYAPQPQGAPDYSYAPQPQNIPGYPTAPTIPGTPRDYTPVMVVEEPARRKKAPAPGACPRCGSKNVQNFDSGEHKCLECKKIYMD
jgi:hypothetical protein